MILSILHFYIDEAPLIRQKRSLNFKIDGDLDGKTRKWMTWSGDKNPNDFKDWSVDSEGNFYMDIPLKSSQPLSDSKLLKQLQEVDDPASVSNKVQLMRLMDKVHKIILISNLR